MNTYQNLLNILGQEYETVSELKQNGRGSVSVVRHKQSGTRYVFRKFIGSGEVYHKLLTVSCPHLPQVYEAAQEMEKVAVLEEYIQGDTLAFLLEGGTLAPTEAKNIAMQLSQALWVLHTMGAVHRDVKPQNVVIRGNEAVLIDFDASRIVKSESTSDTQALGTTGFAAPEQYGLSQSDERVDIYAMGVLLNMMLTGKHPSQQVAPGRLGRIVLKCTMTNPKKRYKSILHFMEALS